MAKKKAAAREATLDDLLSAGVRYRPLDEAPTQDTIAEPPSPSGLRRVGDVGLSLVKGAIGVPEAAVGMADLVTGGRVGKFLENEGGAVGFRPQQAKQQLDEWLSPQQQAANEEVNQAKGVVDTGMAALRNPSVIGHAVAEAVPLMLGGGVIGRALMKAAPVSAVVAGSAGEGIVGAGMSASQIRQETPDRLLTPTQASLAAASGLATGALGYLGGRVAQKMGLVDIDTLIAGKAAPHVNRGFVRQLLQGAVAEGVLEELPQSVQEQVAQNLALDRPLDEGVDKAIVLGTLAGMAMGAGGQVAARSLGDQVRQQKMPESGALTRAANAPIEEAAKAADAAPAVAAEPTPPGDPPSGGSGFVEDERWAGEYYGPGDTTNPVTGERIPAPPAVEPASPADELPAAPMGAKVDPDAALTRMERVLQREDAILRFGGAQDEAAVDPAPAAPPAPAPTTSDAAPQPEPTDIGRADGQPFANRLAASKRLKTAGDGYVIASVAGGYVLRKGGTDVADAVGDGGRGLADAGRGDGGERLRDGQPAALDVAAAPADGQAVAGLEPDGVRPLGSDDAVAERNAELPPANPVAESLAPGRSADGDDGVATIQGAGGRITPNAAPPAVPAVATPETGSPPQVGAAPGKSSRLQPVQDDRLGDDDMRAELEAAKADIGWSQRGGQIIRDPRTAVDPNSPTAHLEGDVVGRTPWLGSDLWRNRPTEGGRVNEAEANEAIDKALRGEPMNAKQRRFVQHALDSTVERMREQERRLFDALEDAKMEAEQDGDASAVERFWASVAEIEAQEERDAIESEGPADAEDGGRAGGTEGPAAAVAPQGAGAAEAQARPAGGDAEGLTLSAPTREEVLAQQAALEQERADREAPADKPKSRLTGEQVDIFNPQGSIFDAPAEAAAPLYASRPVTNAADIIAWAASQGFKSTLKPEDLHVTVAYSRDPVDGAKAGAADAGVSIGGGARTVEPLGDKGAVVLKFTSPELQARWKQYRDAGASWDYDSYTPHVTLTYDGAGVDLSKVEPYTGPIELGPEKQEPLNVDKADDYKEAGEAPTSQAPRETPQPAAEAAQPNTRDAALVEARKRLSVLNSLAKCLA